MFYFDTADVVRFPAAGNLALDRENPIPKRRRGSQADVLNVGTMPEASPYRPRAKRIGMQERTTNPNAVARRIRSLAEHAVIGGSVMLVERSGVAPMVSADAWVASSAVVAGNVTIDAGCMIDHGALQVSSGPQVRIAAGVAVMPGAVIRSAGGADRPAFPVEIGMDCLIGPQASLVGCQLGEAVYVATQGMIFQAARIGDGCRLGVRVL